MKVLKLIYLVLGFLFFLYSGCNTEDSNTSQALLRVDLQSGFYKDSVRILIDNDVLLDSVVSTNAVLSLAWTSKNLTVNTGYYKFSAIIFGECLFRETDFFIHDTSTVTINLSSNPDDIKFKIYDFFIYYM